VSGRGYSGWNKIGGDGGIRTPGTVPRTRDFEKAMSAQQLAIVDLAGKQKILLDSIDTWLFTQPSLVNSRKRSVIPVVLQRQALADSLVRYLAQLGLERRHKVNK